MEAYAHADMVDVDPTDADFAKLVALEKWLTDSQRSLQSNHRRAQVLLGLDSNGAEALATAVDDVEVALNEVTQELDRRNLSMSREHVYKLRTVEHEDAIEVTLGDGTTVEGIVGTVFDMAEEDNYLDRIIHVDAPRRRLCIKLVATYAEARFAAEEQAAARGIESVAETTTPSEREYTVVFDGGDAVQRETVTARSRAEATTRAREQVDMVPSPQTSTQVVDISSATE